MQGQAQRNAQIFLRQPANLIRQTAGADGHVAQAQVQPFFFVDRPQKPHGVVVIIQRLAAAHEDDMAHPAFFAQIAVGQQHLREHFPAGKASDAAVEGAGAERAAHFAPHLRGDAQRIAVMIVHQHALDQVVVPAAEQEFDRVVLLGGEHAVQLHGQIVAGLHQLLPQGLGQVAHLRKGHAPGEPAVHLTGPESGLTQLFEVGSQLLGGHIQQDPFFRHQ